MPQSLSQDSDQSEQEVGQVEQSAVIAEVTVDDDWKNPETIEVPLRKTTKATATIVIGQDEHGQWYSRYQCRSLTRGGIGDGTTEEGAGSRKAAVLCALDEIDHDIGEGHNEQIAQDIDRFYKIVQDWLDEPLESSEPAESPVESEEPVSEENAPAPSPSPIADPMEHFSSQLDEATKKVAACCLAQAKAEAAAKQAKSEAKAAIEALQKLVDNGPEFYPLFDGSDPHAEMISPTTGETRYAAEQAATAPANSDPYSDESWKAVPLGELEGIPASVLEQLAEAEIATVGDLAIWSQEKALTDIKGIGAAKATKIEDALEQFWAKRMPAQVADAAEPASEGSDAKAEAEAANVADDTKDDLSSL